MAAVLTGLEVKSSGDFVGELVEGELRPLDCAERIIKEAADLLPEAADLTDAGKSSHTTVLTEELTVLT